MEGQRLEVGVESKTQGGERGIVKEERNYSSQYSNWSLSTEYIEFIYRDGVQIILNTDEGRDGGEVKLELCLQSNTAVVETKKRV